MKHEVLLETKRSVTIDDLNNSSNVGYITRDGEKCHIVQVGNGPVFIGATSTPHKTPASILCNSAHTNNSNTLVGVIKYLIDDFSVTKFYSFDTRKELYKWLAED